MIHSLVRRDEMRKQEGSSGSRLEWLSLCCDCSSEKHTLETAEARRTTILQPVEQKPHSQKDRQDEKAEGYVPDEGTR